MYELNENITNLCIELEKLFKQGVKLVVAPEMCTTGYGYTNRKSIEDYVDTLPGKATNAISELTKKYDAYVVFGLAEKDVETDLYYNSAALVGPEGYIGKYRKMHQWETEEHWAAWGDIEVPVFSTELGNIGINICMDASYFESARLAALDGADILAFSTNSSGGAVWALPARAIQNGIYIVSANRSNTELGYHMIGASAIWSPLGEKLVEAPYLSSNDYDRDEAQAFLAEINPVLYSNPNKDLLSHRRPEIYKDLSLYISPWNYTKSTESKNIKAIALQYEPITGDTKKTKELILDLLHDVIDVDLIVLPELSLTGTYFEKFSIEANEEEAIAFAKDIATKFNTSIIIGSIEEDNNKLYNSAILIDNNGQIIGTYRKTHLSEADKKWATAGDTIEVFEVDNIGKVGILIGEDVCYPEAAGILSVLRSDIIAIPSAWYGQYGAYVEINNSICKSTIPENTMVLWDSISQTSGAYSIVSNFVGERGYKGSSALNTIDPIYGLDQPITASNNDTEVLEMEFDTLQLDSWINQDVLQASRRTNFYNPLIK
ncbi:nitrilase [Candidatus Epulonipiscioides gigas]|nr:nitrilase [Epulopiscium sp. SCG-C07WGA-EpuloA2]